MTTYTTLAEDRCGPIYTQDTPEGIPGTPVEIPDPSAWPPRPSQHHALHWDGERMYWRDMRSSAQKAAEARLRRDRELAACDWVSVRAFDLAQAVPSAWAAYRQALRDLTEQAGFPDAIEWPTAPG